MMINGHNHSDFSENMQRCHDYIKALEEERRKIQVFQRELPLCLDLVTQAIETCQQQLSGTTADYNLHGQQSECSEQTSSDGPVFEEFIPIKRASSDSDGEEEEQNSKKPKNETIASNKDGNYCNDKNPKKSDWLRSVQLWNQTPDLPSEDDSAGKFAVSEVKRNGGGGAFHPFKKEKSTGSDVAAAAPTQGPMNGAAPPPPTIPTAENGGSGGGDKKEEKDGQSQRKARRCWSPELHRRFLQALQQLGGSHAATPKQIRDLMKVDGLTNDEVKSHLQKYRLHTRRPSPSTHNNNNTQTPQFVVVGGLWMPPEYSAMATTTTSAEAAASKKLYAPIAAPPPQPPLSPKQRQHIKPSSQSDDRGSYSKGGAQTCSPVTSSSTRTATVSPAC